MIEGMKLIMHRILIGIFLIICLIPVYRLIRAFVDSQLAIIVASGRTPGFTDAITYCDLGVGMIPFIIFAGVGIAVFHLYYRAVRKRQYEGQYSQDSMMQDGLNR